MGFLEKLQLKTPEKPLQKLAQEREGEISAPPKRKRGRPRKYPPASPRPSASSREAGQADEAWRAGPPKEMRGTTEEKPVRKAEPARGLPEEGEPEGELTIDIYETDEELVIQSPVAGVKPEDLDISFEDDMLVIHGERPLPQDEGRKNTILQECHWGPFSRRLILPLEVEGTKIKASLERGVLIIRMPKVGTRRKKKVVVEELGE